MYRWQQVISMETFMCFELLSFLETLGADQNIGIRALRTSNDDSARIQSLAACITNERMRM